MINKLKFFVPERILRTLYCILVLPYINYGILIWGQACKTYLEKNLWTSEMGFKNNIE